MTGLIIAFVVAVSIIVLILYIIYRKDTYDIVYKPLSGRYYPRCNGYFIYHWSSGRYSLECSIEGCLYSATKEGAIKIIERYKEYLGTNDVIIKL